MYVYIPSQHLDANSHDDEGELSPLKKKPLGKSANILQHLSQLNSISHM